VTPQKDAHCTTLTTGVRIGPWLPSANGAAGKAGTKTDWGLSTGLPQSTVLLLYHPIPTILREDVIIPLVKMYKWRQKTLNNMYPVLGKHKGLKVPYCLYQIMVLLLGYHWFFEPFDRKQGHSSQQSKMNKTPWP
jgi:hypothetical protein